MRHTVKALRLIIVILWIAVLLLPITVALSLWKVFEARNNVAIGEPIFSMSNGNLSISVTFYMNNTGFYDISELYVNIRICSENGEIAGLSTQSLDIPAGRVVESNLSVSVSLTDVLSRDRGLLTNSKDLNVSAALHFRVAYILALNVARNFTYKWGAPFSNLGISQINFNGTHLSFRVSFSNNASFSLSGPLHLELCNASNVPQYSAEQELSVPAGGFYEKLFEMPYSESAGIIRLYFADIPVLEKRWGSP
ncbi:MAG: hypothetical protein QXK18_04180 [Candidatus Bathyarchaeia archaeon]